MELKEANIACLALGNVNEWMLPLVAFEMLLPALAGVDYYLSFWTGGEAPDAPEIAETLSELLWLYCGDSPADPCNPADGYFHPDVDDASWTEGLDLLINGEAAMAPMGDWATGYLDGEGFSDYEAVPFPAREGLEAPYIFFTDSFTLPAWAPNPEGARRWLSTIGSEAGQLAFSAAKGSIPAMLGVDVSGLDAVAQATIADFEDADARGSLALALSGLLPSDTLSELSAALLDSMQARTTELIAGYLEHSYD